jgi:YebC/PmpR family DNA-binding regulatory protein
MAGHSKWANIKHKKAKEDEKRGKAFTKLIKEITVCARQGGDPAHNAQLRNLVEKAKGINMPQDNVTRAIKKGTGELPGITYEEILYEGYGPEGIAVLAHALTDNKNRTVAELRRLFSSKGGSLAETGSVNWMFEKKGVIKIVITIQEDELLESLYDYDIDDVRCGQGWCTIVCDVHALDTIKKLLQEKDVTIDSAELEWVAKIPLVLEESKAQKIYDFLHALDDHDDIQHVYSNIA